MSKMKKIKNHQTSQSEFIEIAKYYTVHIKYKTFLASLIIATPYLIVKKKHSKLVIKWPKVPHLKGRLYIFTHTNTHRVNIGKVGHFLIIYLLHHF